MRLADLAARYRLASPFAGASLDQPVSGITHDSRCVRPGFVFVALGGTQVDGHAFVDAAFAKGAIAAIVNQGHRAAPIDRRLLLLADDTREALAWAAAAFHGFPAQKLAVVGVTGTNGKTTTTHLIEAAMAAAGWQTGVAGTLGVRYQSGGLQTTVDLGFTTPQAPELQQILAMMAASGVRGVAMEVSSHALDQLRAAYIPFEVGVFTNLTRDHLDYHGTEEAYAAAKAKLFASLREDGVAVVNRDDPRGDQMLAAARSGNASRIL
ncbi:MAG: UDP-N-acetylmuramoyl-L-alanyl-D-glutamate--2,6-diaminopimelate ligase, partial [Cyanobacteria bacterium REEB65]|nr:UDP-N-acetylmuramoyl-L-alanyl-D-glutamate--2,6-diaminopimelate ligase [Cyanobacteria bacterium REEB65]